MVPPSDQGIYSPADVARILDLPLATVEQAAHLLPRYWNVSTGEWWLTEDQLEVWRHQFTEVPEVPVARTRTLHP